MHSAFGLILKKKKKKRGREISGCNLFETKQIRAGYMNKNVIIDMYAEIQYNS